MDAKRKIIIIVAVMIIAILIIALIWWLVPTPQTAIPQANTAVTSTTTPGALNPLPPPTPAQVAAEKNYPLGLKQLAFSFAERYGTYSTDAQWANLQDLLPLMTDRLKVRTETMMKNPVAAVSGFESFDSVALSSELSSAVANQATVLVKTQRTRIDADGKANTFYQDLLLKFVKNGEEWLVDEATWQ